MNILRISPGDEFGRLTVVRRDTTVTPGHGKSIFWLCKCTCNNVKTISGQSLAQGGTKSCGCLNTEVKHIRHLVRNGRLRGSLSAKRLWANDDGDWEILTR